MPLDRNREFGHVFDETNGAAFEQGGVLFDSLGNEIVLLQTPSRGRPKKSVDHSAVDNQLSAQV